MHVHIGQPINAPAVASPQPLVLVLVGWHAQASGTDTGTSHNEQEPFESLQRDTIQL